MGRTRQGKRKVPVTAGKHAPVNGQKKSPVSASSTATRTLIRKFHVLIKKREQLLRETNGQKQKNGSVRDPACKEKLSTIEQEIEMLGGLERYQAMSSIGQSATKGGGSEKVLISWIKEMRAKKKILEYRLRCVPVVFLMNIEREQLQIARCWCFEARQLRLVKNVHRGKAN